VAALDFAGEEPSLAECVPGGLPGAGVPGGLGPVGTVGPVVKLTPPPPPRRADPPKATSEAIPHVRIGGLIQAARLTYQVKPVYPPLARQARVQGTVKLEAVIDREGRIRNLRVLSGPPLLVKAAVDAVLQWRYEPTYLNSVAAEVLTQVDVNFTLLP
jgi:protein TonB